MAKSAGPSEFTTDAVTQDVGISGWRTSNGLSEKMYGNIGGTPLCCVRGEAERNAVISVYGSRISAHAEPEFERMYE